MNTKILLTLILISIFSAQSWSQCANSSNIISFSYNGHNYEIIKEMKSWTAAAACAVERGGYLVQINDQNEQTAIYNQILSSGISSTYTSVMDGGGTAYIWIGATDKTTEGTWIWDGNNDNTGTNFWTGQGAAGAGGGSAVGGAFVNWGGKSAGSIQEPDNYANIQDAAAIALEGWPQGTTFLGIGGEWNDIDLSNTLYFIVEKESGVGIKESENIDIQLFPNPANNQSILNLHSESLKIEKISIQNSLGQTILVQNEADNSKVNIEGLLPGIYFIEIRTMENLIFNRKLIIE